VIRGNKTVIPQDVVVFERKSSKKWGKKRAFLPLIVWRKPRDSRVVPESLLAMRQTKKLLSIIIKVRSANCTKKSKGGH